VYYSIGGNPMLKLLIFLILSIPIGDRINIVYDECDYAEINTFYASDGTPNFRQIIFWEWRKGERQDKKTGIITYQWGYGVKGWKRLSLERPQESAAQGGSNEYLPAKTKRGWYSTWIEGKNSKPHIYHIKYKYVTETHTTYDPEQYNKRFVPDVMRTGFR
jgi:hypothetical protein